MAKRKSTDTEQLSFLTPWVSSVGDAFDKYMEALSPSSPVFELLTAASACEPYSTFALKVLRAREALSDDEKNICIRAAIRSLSDGNASAETLCSLLPIGDDDEERKANAREIINSPSSIDGKRILEDLISNFAYFGEKHKVAVLLDASADILLKNEEGKTALHLAAAMTDFSYSYEFDDSFVRNAFEDAQYLLLEHVHFPETLSNEWLSFWRDEDGQTPLQIIARDFMSHCVTPSEGLLMGYWGFGGFLPCKDFPQAIPALESFDYFGLFSDEEDQAQLMKVVSQEEKTLLMEKAKDIPQPLGRKGL